MSAATILQAYTKLVEKFGKEKADVLASYIVAVIKEELEKIRDERETKDFVKKENKTLVTKGDIIKLQSWMIGVFITMAIMVIGLYFYKR